MKTEKEERAEAELKDIALRLYKAGVQLAISLKKCKLIGIKDEYTNDELEVFDAFTSRFARVSDILTQRIFRLFDILEFEESKTFLDALNKAEQRGIITSSLDFKEIRELRNEIAHEYALRDFTRLITDVMQHTPQLLNTIEKSIEYGDKLTSL